MLSVRFRHSAGFSLVELMVGMLLGLMLIAGAASIYLATKRSYVEVEQVANLTENARFAEQVIGESLRHLGFLGAVTANRVAVQQSLRENPPSGDCTSPPKVGAYELDQLAFAAPTDQFDCLGDAFVPSEAPLNDVLVIKHVRPKPYFDTTRVPDPNEPRAGYINTPTILDSGRVYVMTNNVGGLLFDGTDPPSITTGGEFPNGNAWEYQYDVFYIRDGDTPTLSRRTLTYDGTSSMVFRTEDLAEGVERLRLLFGFDSTGDGDVDTYKSAAFITSTNRWDDVESVEVYMLVRSATPDVQYTDVKTYQLGDVPIVFTADDNDHYRRLISATSISLRNLKLMIRGNAS